MGEVDVQEKVKDIIALAESMQDDAKKFSGGNKAAGVRVRKTLQKIKAEAHQLRWDILYASKAS